MRRLGAWLERVPIDDPTDRRQAVLVQLLCFAGIAWVLVAIALAAVRGSLLTHPLANGVLPASVALALLGEVALVRHGRYRLALYLGLACVIIPAVVLVGQGFANAPHRMLYLVLVLVGAAMLRGHTALRLAAFVALAALATGAARDAGYLGGPASLPAPPLGQFGNAAVPLIVIVVLLDRFAGPLREALAEAVRRAHELKASEERFRLAFATSPDAMLLVRMPDQSYVEVNDAFTRFTGYAAGEVLGRTLTERALWADPALFASVLERLVQGDPVSNVEAGFLRKDGSAVTALVSARVVTIGSAPYLLAIAKDITERKRLEGEREVLREQLLHAQKLEAIGRLAGGVAHDFNNVLTSVLASAEMLMQALPPDHPGRGDVQQIDADARRAAELTRQLLSFARRNDVAPQVIRVEERARSLEKMLRRVMGAKIAVETSFASQGWPVFVDPGQVEQVIMNLAVNARDAMPSGGRLTIRSENATVLTAPARAGDPPPGEYLLLSVADDGTGMTPEVMEHAFEPFFTTKGSQGTGLGLATCYGIVSQAGGTITVDSAPGAGTRFRIYFPRAAVVCGPPSEARALDLHGSETILVVEDDPSVRRLAVRSLQQLGYAVIDAGSASEARAKLSRHAGGVECLLMDVQLPDGEGADAAGRILAGREGVRVLYVSGSPEALAAAREGGGPSPEVLAKPYSPIDLARRVRLLLDRGGARAATAT
ncbi:MAG: PAS domain S-box protein [Deltaproteobacteria bacterium]|nr:PAS domain S-box protein [Deltaproteobacteria bacterium]